MSKLHVQEYEFGTTDSFCCRVYLSEDEDSDAANEHVNLAEVLFEKTKYLALSKARAQAIVTLQKYIEGVILYEMSSEE